MNDKMNDEMKSFIELAKADIKQAMELMSYIPGAKEAILMHTIPTLDPDHRDLFRNAAKNTETDPKILDSIGVRADIPTKIRYAVIANPSTRLETIEQMARQSGNFAVTRRAKEFLDARKAEKEAAGKTEEDMMESKFKMSTKDIKKIIREELQRVI